MRAIISNIRASVLVATLATCTVFSLAYAARDFHEVAGGGGVAKARFDGETQIRHGADAAHEAALALRYKRGDNATFGNVTGGDFVGYSYYPAYTTHTESYEIGAHDNYSTVKQAWDELAYRNGNVDIHLTKGHYNNFRDQVLANKGCAGNYQIRIFGDMTTVATGTCTSAGMNSFPCYSTAGGVLFDSILHDGTKSWPANALRGMRVTLGNGDIRNVIWNNNTTLAVAGRWSAAPVAGVTTYAVDTPSTVIDGAGFDFMNVDNVVLSQVKLQYTGAALGIGVNFTNSKACYVEDCWLESDTTGGYGVQYTAFSTGVARRNYCNNGASGAVITNSAVDAYQNNIGITQNSWGAGIFLAGASEYSPNGISDNYISNMNGAYNSGIDVKECIISWFGGNRIENATNNGVYLHDGGEVRSLASTTSAFGQGQLIRGCGSHGVYLLRGCVFEVKFSTSAARAYHRITNNEGYGVYAQKGSHAWGLAVGSLVNNTLGTFAGDATTYSTATSN